MTWKRQLTDLKSGDDLVPLEPVDLEKIHSFSDLLEAMEKTSFSGRQLGKAFYILHECFSDPDTLVVMTLSGAMTVAKQGLIIGDLIDRGFVNILVSTGALLTHGLIEGMGIKHYQCRSNIDDTSNFKKGYNRIYDTIELESSLQFLESMLGDHLEELIPAINGKKSPAGSADFCRRFGLLMERKFSNHRNILTSACKKGVPVYIPAFTDCEMGVDLGVRYLYKTNGFKKEPFLNGGVLPYNPFADLMDFANRIYSHEGPLAIFTIGGGVPRNWGQQVAPLIDIMSQQGFPVSPRFFSRGVRICPEPAHWGGLSGCSYKEGISWGKFIPESKGGKYAEVYADATTVLPLLIKAVFERMEKNM
jgi:deoxyhypusine synthase